MDFSFFSPHYRERILYSYVENKGKSINSEGSPEGEARGRSRGIYRLSRVFHIRMLFSLDLKEINHSYTKYEGKVYKFFPSVWRIGIRFVFDLLIYPDGSKIS